MRARTNEASREREKEVRRMPKVKDLMVSEVVTIDDSASIVDAAKRMIQEKKGPLPVVEEEDRIHAIVTDRDIIAHVVAEGRDPSALRVHDIATHELVTIAAEEDAEEARQLMADNQLNCSLAAPGGRLV